MQPPRSTLRVLVVDDDSVLTDLLATLLGVLGHAVETAGTGDLALQRLAAPQPPDIVLIDLRMPGMDGTALAAAIASLPHPPRLIGMSGAAPTPLQATHFDTFLQKPFGMDGLERVLTESTKHTASQPLSAVETATTFVLDRAIYERLSASMPPAQLRALYQRTLAYVRQTAPALDTASVAERIELAHTLQGSCSMVGAAELATLAGLTASPLKAPAGASSESSQSCKMLRASDRLEDILKLLSVI